MDAPPSLPPPGPRQPIGPMLLGIFVSNAIGGALLFALVWLIGAYKNSDVTTLIAWPSFFLIPFFVGLVAAWFWRGLRRILGISFLDALWVTLVGLAAAAIILREGVVCLVIVSPALYVFIVCGILLGRVWFRPDYSKLTLTVFPLVALLALADSLYHLERQDVVIDRLGINEPPEKDWRNVIAF